MFNLPEAVRSGPPRQANAPAVMYASGKIIFIGGGNDPDTHVPTAATERIDFGVNEPAWSPAASMRFPRRQHNATILPGGTVLVTGGTRGVGGLDVGFNDLTDGEPVLTPELWNPHTDEWVTLARETNERCYHSTALLLPDGTVLSAGGGEYRPDNTDLPPEHVHRDGQVFRPPFLFRGDRPDIGAAPDEVRYGQTFEVEVSGPAVQRLTLLRLDSVTYAMDCNQRFLGIIFDVTRAGLSATAPSGPSDCPPGWYMLSALSAAGVPSHAPML